jgi:hypothetical protein
MRTQILAIAAMVMLAAGTATSAMALSHGAGHRGTHVRSVHAAATHASHTKRGNRLAGVRGPTSWSQDQAGYRGGFIDLGPLGMTAACGSYRSKHYCGQGYSVSGWSY